MNGLINQNMAPPDESAQHEAVEPPEVEQQEGAEEGGDIEYEKFMLAVQKTLYDSPAGDQIADQLAKADDVPQTISDIAYDMVATIDQKSGGSLPDEDMAAAAFDTLGLIAEIAQTVGHPIAGRDIAHASKLMMGRYLQEQGASDDELNTLFSQIDLDAAGQAIDQGEVQ